MEKEPKAASRLLHKALAAASGAVGGGFGLAALPVELPISTIIMLRSIGDFARSEGEDLTDPESDRQARASTADCVTSASTSTCSRTSARHARLSKNGGSTTTPTDHARASTGSHQLSSQQERDRTRRGAVADSRRAALRSAPFGVIGSLGAGLA
jgi:hypothetical protein